jgi:hypothetical protein
VGVKLEDIAELLGAACSSLDDELEMQALSAEVVQALFEEGQRRDLAALPTASLREKKRPLTRSTRRGHRPVPSFLPLVPVSLTPAELLLFGESASLNATEEEEQPFDYSIPSSGSDKSGSLHSLLTSLVPPLSRPIARVVLKHSTLKGVRSIPSVDQVPPSLLLSRSPHPERLREVCHPPPHADDSVRQTADPLP